MVDEIERRGVADVVGAGLERQPPHRHPAAGELPAEVGVELGTEHQLLGDVRVMDGGEDARREPLGPGHRRQRLNILGETTPAVPGSRKEEGETDPVVMTDPAADVVDVGIDPLAEIRHLVDEADLRRQQRVGDIFRHLRALRRHHQERMLRAEIGGVEIPQQFAVGGIADPDDNPVGPLEVVDRGPLLEKLRIARHAADPAGGGPQASLDPSAGPNRDGALRDDQRRRVEMRSDRFGHLPEGREIGRAVSRGRGADGEEDDLRPTHRRRGVGGEPETAGVDVA